MKKDILAAFIMGLIVVGILSMALSMTTKSRKARTATPQKPMIESTSAP